ncbi:MAG: lamin tail domain-containing protein, partial [Patescibacteria group bacterium]|nr:lamin tail domain-containing protein [Patescibacteria group bacterium]
DNGGGMRIVQKNDDGNIVTIFAEKYWGSLEEIEPEPEYIPEPDLTPEPESNPEPVPEPEPTPIYPEENSAPETIPEPEPTPEPESEQATSDNSDNSWIPASAGMTKEEIIPEYSSFQITISEFMPDPVGSDDGEWIEIKNLGEDAVDMSGWKIDDIEGGSKPFQIPDGTVIAPHGFFVFYKSQTKLALNNSEDSARLINPLDEVFQEVSYSDNTVGVSYALDSDEWGWTTSPTPSSDNIISAPPEPKKTSTNKIYTNTFSKTVDLKDIRDLPKGAKVTIKGVVSAPPSVLGSQIFYIAGSGLQVYMYKKDFPDLALGDEIQLSGELSEVSGETRIKIKNREDITFLSNGEEPTPHIVNIGDVGEDLEGSLVKISGEVIEIINNGFYLADKQGNEVKIYLKTYTEISSDLVKPGNNAEVTGIVSQTKTGYRLLPRYEDDIVVKEQKNTMVTNKEKKKINSKYKYLVAILGAVFLAIGINYYKKRKKYELQRDIDSKA